MPISPRGRKWFAGARLTRGVIASKIVNKSGSGILMDILLDIVGAVVVLVIYHAIRGSRAR